MLVFRKKRSPNNQQERATTASAMSAMQNETDWVSNAIRVAELASATGGLLPFPYLKGAAELFKVLIMPIKQMRQNQDDYKTLAINVTDILQILHEGIRKDSEATASSLSSFEQGCKDFHSCLQDISNDLESRNNTKQTKSGILRRYFAAERERDLLTHYHTKINELRSNLILRGIMCSQLNVNTQDEIDSHYEQVRLGDLYVLRSSSNVSVEHWEVQWRQETRTRMVRVYKGENAIARFKAEREWYTQNRHPNIMQLFGFIEFQNSPGLVFNNSWCIPYGEYERNFTPLQLCVDIPRRAISYNEGLYHLKANKAQHSFIPSRDWMYYDLFIGFENHDDGFIITQFVSLFDGRGVLALEWTPNLLRDARVYQYDWMTLDTISPEEAAKRIEAIFMPSLSEQLDTPPRTDLLWNFYGAISVFTWKDVSPPGYPVYIGDILLANKRDGRLEASNAAMLGFIPCEEPLSYWITRKKLQDYRNTSSRVPIEDCGKHFRVRLPVNVGSSSVAQDFETVVIEHDTRYTDQLAWERLARAFISQIGHIHSQVGWPDIICIVTGFSWHLQIPASIRYSAGIAGNKELYFFISKPAVHDQDLKTYWSFDASGSEIISSPDILDTLGFTPPIRLLSVTDIEWKDFQSIRHAHVTLNIDPKTNEGARILNLPLVKFGVRSDYESDADDGFTVNDDEDIASTESGGVANEDITNLDYRGDADEDIATVASGASDETAANSYYTADESDNESTGEAEAQS